MGNEKPLKMNKKEIQQTLLQLLKDKSITLIEKNENNLIYSIEDKTTLRIQKDGEVSFHQKPREKEELKNFITRNLDSQEQQNYLLTIDGCIMGFSSSKKKLLNKINNFLSSIKVEEVKETSFYASMRRNGYYFKVEKEKVPFLYIQIIPLNKIENE